MSLPADDLLSAFHDGEVNSAERAAVEQRLAASTEARRELSEIRQVSSLLQALPRDRLQAEFPQQVLQAIEREMLIPSQRVEPLTSSAGGSPNWSRRWLGAAAILTSAAGLLLLVRVVEDRSGRTTTESRPLASVPELRSAPAEVAMSDRLESRGPSFGGGAPPPMAADAPTSAPRKSGVAGPMAAANSVVANSPASSSLAPGGVVSRESNNLYFDQSALRDAKIGDVVRAMQTEGTEVAVVWLTVVDRQEGFAGLQILLGDHSESDKKSSKSERPNAAANQMHAVFVESDAEQLTAMLKQVLEESSLQSLEVDQPIELAQLEEVRHGRMLAADKSNDASSTTRTARKADAAKPLAEANSAKQRAVSAPTQSAEKKIASTSAVPESVKAKGTQDAKDQREQLRQVPMELPLDVLVQNHQLSQQSRNRGVFRKQSGPQSAGEKASEKAPADQRPMQVLFVVVDQAQAGKSPTTPGNSAKPTSVPTKVRSEPAKPNGQDGAA